MGWFFFGEWGGNITADYLYEMGEDALAGLWLMGHLAMGMIGG